MKQSEHSLVLTASSIEVTLPGVNVDSACVSKDNVEHCGLCEDFPCDFFIGHFDLDNPEGQRNALVRTGLLAYGKRHGDKKWLDLIERMGSWKKIKRAD